MNEQLDRIEGKVDRALRLLDGGDEPERGLIVRMDRIEQRHRTIAKITSTALGAWVVLAATAAWAWLTGWEHK